MGTTYDLGTSIGQCRLLAADSNIGVDPVTFASLALLQDEEYTALLALENQNVKLAAAAALDIIASNEALVTKKMRMLDLTTDGPAVAKALRDHATLLRKQVGDDQAAAEAGTDFDVAEWVLSDATYAERIIDQAERGALP